MKDLGSLWDAGGRFLLNVLEFFRQITGSYGLAIILLTIAVRLLLYPLSQKQMVSMAKMQRIQPRLKVIQEKYANDKQKLNEEMMKLYREHNVNPLAGCFPLLIQIPVMILLFRVLMGYQAADTSFLGVSLEKSLLAGMAQALSILPKDGAAVGFFTVLNGIVTNPAGLLNVHLYLPTLVLTVGICLLTWLQQKLSGASSTPQMATFNVVMPFLMGFICLSLPGGVLIYWGTSSLIGILQQWFVMGKAKEDASVKPVLYKNKPVGGSGRQQAEVFLCEDEDDEEEEYEDDEDDEDDEKR